MKAYILSIAGAVLLGAVLSIVVPNGKTGTFLKGMAKLLILSVMIAPLTALLKDPSFISADSPSITIDGEYLENASDMMEEADERTISSAILLSYGISAQVNVSRSDESPFSYEKIAVKITDFGINEEDEHIHIIEKIKAALEARYGCEAEVG